MFLSVIFISFYYTLLKAKRLICMRETITSKFAFYFFIYLMVDPGIIPKSSNTISKSVFKSWFGKGVIYVW
jgi:hypothetical protein